MSDAATRKAQNEEMAGAIEALLFDENGIEQIEARLGGFNIFEAIGQARSEARHSDFLAFLLNPNETHGLGAEFLTRFVVEVLRTMPTESRPLSLIEIALSDLEGTLVLREHHQIDVLCIEEAHGFVLAIENKVGSGEHSRQLERYRSYLEEQYRDSRRVLAYLTPDHEEPSDEHWAPIGYSDVLSIVETLGKKCSNSLGEAVTIALDHYARMLRRNIVTDDELKNIARTIYRKHKVALDFIFEQRPDDQLEISEFVADLASKEDRIELVHCDKNFINFFPKVWTGIHAFNATPADKWTRTGHSLLFEVRNKPDSIKMAIVIGPGVDADEEWRKQIFDFSHQHPTIFPNARKRLTNVFTQIYSTTMVGRTALDSQPVENIKDRLARGFRRFMDEKFDAIVNALAKAFGNA